MLKIDGWTRGPPESVTLVVLIVLAYHIGSMLGILYVFGVWDVLFVLRIPFSS